MNLQYGKNYKGDVQVIGGTSKLSGGTIDEITTIKGGTLNEVSSLKTIIAGTVSDVESLKTIIGGTISDVESIKTIIGGTIQHIPSVIITGGTLDSVTLFITGTFETGTITGLAGTIQEVGNLVTGTLADVESVKTIIGGTIQEVASLKTIIAGTISDVESIKTIVAGTISDVESIKTIIAGTISDVESVKTIVGGTINEIGNIVTGTLADVESIKTIVAGTISDVESIKTIIAGTISDVESVKTIIGGTIGQVGNVGGGTINSITTFGTNVLCVDPNGAAESIEIEHYKIHVGKKFSFTDQDGDVDTGAPKYYGIETGTNAFHIKFQFDATGPGYVDVFEDSQIGGSSAIVTGVNHNRVATGTTPMIVKADATLASGTGVRLFTARLGAGGKQDIGGAQRADEFITKAGGTYAIRFTTDGDNNKVGFVLDMYEQY